MPWDELQNIWFKIGDTFRDGAANPLSQASVGSYNSRNDRKRAKAAQDALQHAYASSNLTSKENRELFAEAITTDAFNRADMPTDNSLFGLLRDAVTVLLQYEDAFQEPEIHDLAMAGPAELARIANDAERRTNILGSRGAYDALYDTLLKFVLIHIISLPESMRSVLSDNKATPLIPVRLIELTDNPHDLIQTLLSVFLSDSSVQNHDLFALFRQHLLNKATFASGYTPDYIPDGKKLVFPLDRIKEPVEKILEDYLDDTPMLEVLTSFVHMSIPMNARLEHCHVLGGTGHGKTQCLQYLLHEDLVNAVNNLTSIVVIDSQGDLIRKISSNALFDPDIDGLLANRYILIDPSDIEQPPALNLFDPGLERMANYSPRQRELVFNSLVDIYGRFFGKLLATELTGRQETVFRYLARLMLTIEGATIHTLIELMDDITPFKKQIATLDPTARRFFEKEFSGTGFRGTRQQIKQRLYSVLSIPTFDRLFSAPRSKINFFEALNNGSIILVNTSKDLLKKDGTAILGRFMLALIEHAIMERSIIPEDERTPTWLYIDEAQDYFDETVETMLVQARKYKCGLVLAHQNLAQLDTRLKAVFMGNTSIKIAGGITEDDAKALDADMRTTSEFLLSMKKRQQISEFALSVRNLTSHALKVSIPLGYFESQPKLTPEQLDRLLEMNRQRVGYIPVEEPVIEETIADIEEVLEEQPEPEEHEVGHRDIQNRIKQVAQEQGFSTFIEKQVLDGKGRIDVALERDDLKVAIEVSVTTKPEHELHNVQKCLSAGYRQIWVTSPNAEQLSALREYISPSLLPAERERVSFLSEHEVVERLNSMAVPKTVSQTKVLGYTVHTTQVQIDPQQAQHRRERLAAVLSGLDKKQRGTKL